MEETEQQRKNRLDRQEMMRRQSSVSLPIILDDPWHPANPLSPMSPLNPTISEAIGEVVETVVDVIDSWTD